MREYSVIILCCALTCPTSDAFAAQNAVAQDVQRLHLSPQQLLSLRDFLGPFGRGIEVDASSDGRFILRDAATMAYAGEFSLRVSGGGRLEVDRIDGHARLDPSRAVLLPLRLTDQARAEAVMTLANSEAVKRGAPVTAEKMERIEPQPSLPAVLVAAANLTGAAATEGLTQSRAEFWPDGSGWSASVRLQPGAPMMRITERFFAPIRADVTRVWRDRIVEIEGDTKLAFADFENRNACAVNAACVTRNVRAESGLHVIRWRKTLIAAVPPSLMGQIAVSTTTAAVAEPPAPASIKEDDAIPESGVAASSTPSGDNLPGSPNGR